MGEFLKKIREAQGIPLPKPQLPEPDPTIMALSRDAAQSRLTELRAMVKAFGSPTAEDRSLMASLEARLNVHDSPSVVPTDSGSEKVHTPVQAHIGPIERRRLAMIEQRATS